MKQMFTEPGYRALLAAAAAAMAAPALSGQPALMAYATQIFQGVGYDAGAGASLAVGLYVTKLVFTVPDFLWLDHVDRRVLLKWGLSSISFTWAFAAVADRAHFARLAATSLVVGTAGYQASVGPLSWIVPAEALPASMRMKASALTSLVYSGTVFGLLQVHPLLQQRGTTAFLLVYMCSSAVGYYVCNVLVPETRGRSLEAVERDARDLRLFVQADDEELED
eukprot:TRINITY_DN609_c0_g7_i2.p1 TRINITY_DN609_c0_g7~~TRINITY_DN609_c0_g7_i2.p1  ORF type:complete len:223 (+),score=51.77 TRINITY_DN609_c0_g7_i2:297-965(+)